MRLNPAGASTSRRRGFELECRSVDVQLRPELVDIPVSIIVERDVGRDVERRAGQLGWKGLLRVAEVIVAINENPRVLVGQRLSQAGARDVGKAEVERSPDVKLVVFLPAPRVQ